MMKELVSIVIPVYNAEKYIAESINSCLNQTYSNIEVVVVNDGSDDKTKNIVRDLMDTWDKIKFVDLSHIGKVKAINKGIEQARGNYIAIHAADDVCFPERIMLEVDLIKSTNAVLVYGDMEIVDASLNTLADSFWDYSGIKSSGKTTFEKLLFQNYISGGTILFDAKLKQRIFPIPENLQFEDWWISVIAAYNGKVVPTREKLIKYRQHGSNDNSSYMNKKASLLVEKQLRLVSRTFNYYKEFERYIIENEKDENKKGNYIKILRLGTVTNEMTIEKSLFKRMCLAMIAIKDGISWMNMKSISKFFLYMLLGRNLLFLKYQFFGGKR